MTPNGNTQNYINADVQVVVRGKLNRYGEEKGTMEKDLTELSKFNAFWKPTYGHEREN